MKKKIIVAEDSLTIQKVFELTFHRSEYEVTYLDQGKDLKGMAQEIAPELIICDVTLPDMDGYTLVGEIKKDPNLKKVPSLLLVGTMETLDEEKFRISCAEGFLYKPFESQVLLDKVEEMIREFAIVEESPGEDAEPVEEGEGWDFSDVFEDVDHGQTTKDATDAEGSFLDDLVRETELPDMNRVEDFDVSLDDISTDETASSLEDDAGMGASPGEPEPYLPKGDGEVPLDELTELGLNISDGDDGVIQSEGADDSIPMEESGPDEEGDADIHDAGEGKVMEEIARHVEEFPISSGYEVTCDIRPRGKGGTEGGEVISGALLEEGLTSALASNEFKDGIQSASAEIVEKILWEVFPAMMEGMKKEIISSIREVASEVVPDVATRIIQEEIRKIREDLESGE